MKIKQLRSVWPKRALALLSSAAFFRLVVIALVFESAWIALSAHYPMAFDEDFHFGLIKLYAHHIGPFLSSQPESANTFGAMYRDPSYLYHYLMSFPFRLISLFSASQTIQILWLRAINIALFASGLVIFRRVLVVAGASKAMANSLAAVLILIPVIPLLAAQINYDNLFFPLTAIALLLSLRINQRLSHHQTLPPAETIGLMVVGLLASLVKYAFLPLLLTLVIYLLIRFRQTFKTWPALRSSLVTSWHSLGRSQRYGLLAVLAVAMIMFGQRYLVNIVRYHTPLPDCAKVLDVEACSDYGPWIRDYSLHNAKSKLAVTPISYSGDWLYGMWLRLFFTLDGAVNQFDTRGPLILPAWTAIIFPSFGTLLLLIYGQRLWRRYDRTVLALLLSIVVVYITVLWLDEFRSYWRTGQPVAINGRYLLPVLLPLMLLYGFAFSEWLRGQLEYKLLVVLVLFVGLAWGGGALTYILRSDKTWYWDNHYVITANGFVQSVVGPAVPSYANRQLYLR